MQHNRYIAIWAQIIGLNFISDGLCMLLRALWCCWPESPIQGRDGIQACPSATGAQLVYARKASGTHH